MLYLRDRDNCALYNLGVPLFSGRWSGANCSLTIGRLRKGFDVLPLFDRERGRDMDFFTDEGKSHWAVLAEEGPDYEHHAPDCKTKADARNGRPC